MNFFFHTDFLRASTFKTKKRVEKKNQARYSRALSRLSA